MEIIIYVVAGTLALIGILWYFMRKKMQKEVWEGVLTDKKEEVTSGDDYDSKYYVLHIQFADGGTKKMTVPRKVFNQFEAGDKLVKSEGQTYPQKAN